MSLTSTTSTIHGKRWLAVIGCGLTLLWMGQAAGGAQAQPAAGVSTASPGNPSASLTQCVTAAGPAERSATFSGEMTTLPGTARMSMRIELQERVPGETSFHAVLGPGLGVWRTSATNVKTYKYDQQVIDLAAPAAYRATIVFRWQGPQRHELRRAERLTSVCHQPEPASTSAEPASSSATGASPAGAETHSSLRPGAVEANSSSTGRARL